MEGLQGYEAKRVMEEVVAKRPPKRIYIRNHSQKVRRIITEVKKAGKVLGWPETIQCKVCYREDVPIEEATLRQGINGRRGDYFMCKSHLE